MSVGVELGSVEEGRSMNRDMGWWKMSASSVSLSFGSSPVSSTVSVELVRADRDLTYGFRKRVGTFLVRTYNGVKYALQEAFAGVIGIEDSY